MKRLINVLLGVGLVSGFAFADGQESFEHMKKLAGTWKGTATVEGSSSEATITYRVTSNGNTIEEVIAPGTSHEMVTMYHLDGKNLVLTHYCSMGNQPHMKMVPGNDPNVINFDFDGGSNIPKGGAHMHSAHIKILGANHLQSQWDEMMGGKMMMHVKMDLHRVNVAAAK